MKKYVLQANNTKNTHTNCYHIIMCRSMYKNMLYNKKSMTFFTFVVIVVVITASAAF